MNKKTLRIAGWALGLSMAVAGIGAAVGLVSNEGNDVSVVKAVDPTETFTFATLASDRGWSNGVAYTSVTVGKITLTTGGGNNGKYYTSDSTWRLYNEGVLTVTAAKGYTVTGVTSDPSQEFDISEGVATLELTETVKFKSIVVSYSGSGESSDSSEETNSGDVTDIYATDTWVVDAADISLDTDGFKNKTDQSYVGSGGITYKLGSGGSNTVKGIAIPGDAKNNITTNNAIFMGKSGAYIYNSTEYDYEIAKFELYENKGASTSVQVAVEFGTSEMTSAISASTTHKYTLDPNDKVYDYTYADMSAGYTFFRIQVMNAYNAHFQFKITFNTPHYEAAEFETKFVSKSISYDSGTKGTNCLSISKGGLGYYDSAMDAYSDLSTEAKKVFASSSEFANARDRLIAWADANQTTLEFNPSTGDATETSKGVNVLPGITNNRSDIALIVGGALSVGAIGIVGASFLLRKKSREE